MDLGASHDVSGKSCLNRGSNPKTVQPVASRYTNYTIPAVKEKVEKNKKQERTKWKSYYKESVVKNKFMPKGTYPLGSTSKSGLYQL